ncbi:MAG: carbon monoxide dehydrogenase [Proteobacteria bacterium]|nr:carbon monoxide dehydrogenase [Pseudomonadota bacterium]
MTLARYQHESIPALTTARDRINAREMSRCTFGSGGTCCRVCNMGPCQIIDGVETMIGVCGATSDTVAARNFARIVGAGVALQVEEAREMVRIFMATAKGETPYALADENKLRELARLIEIDPDISDLKTLALETGRSLLAAFGNQDETLALMKIAPKNRRRIWKDLGVTPRGFDREVVELMHRTHMGVDQEFVNIVRQTSRCALTDGWGVSRVISWLTDILFPTLPAPTVKPEGLRQDMINILIYSQGPLAMETLKEAAIDPEVINLCQRSSATGINLVNGSIGDQETDLLTGCVEIMVVSGSCIMPSISRIIRSLHTRLVTSSNSMKMTGAEHFELTGPAARSNAITILKMAVTAFRGREKVLNPAEENKTEQRSQPQFGIHSLDPAQLAGRISKGDIRGIALIMGCDNYHQQQDSHAAIAEILLRNDIFIISNGCAANSLARSEEMQGNRVWEMAGSKLQAACQEMNLPPILPMGTCINSSQLLQIADLLIQQGMGKDLADLPVVAAAPAWISEKIVTAGQCLVASGIDVFFSALPVTGSRKLADYLQHGCRTEYEACWQIDKEPNQMAQKIIARIDSKRQELNQANSLFVLTATTSA